MNATLITFNGNEQMLQNDMGNTKILDSKTGHIMGLREGFVPVGLKEHGGIMYIASVNKDGIGEIGTIPSPVITYSKCNSFSHDSLNIELPNEKSESPLYKISDTLLYPEDKFVVNLNNGALGNLILNNEIEVLLHQSASLKYPLISTLNKKGIYKVNLYAQNDLNTINLQNLIDKYPTYFYKGEEYSTGQKYWFNSESTKELDLDRMNLLDGSSDSKCFMHYPCISPGNVSISFLKEELESFELTKNYARGDEGLVYPVLIERDMGGSINYITKIHSFIYKTESGIHVDKIVLNLKGETFEIKNKEYKVSENISGLWRSKVQNKENTFRLHNNLKTIRDHDVDPVKSFESETSLDDYIIELNLGTKVDQWIVLTVDYYSNQFSSKLGTYTLKYNPYLLDYTTQFVTDYNFEPQLYSGQFEFSQMRQIYSSDDEILVDENYGKNKQVDVTLYSNNIQLSGSLGEHREDSSFMEAEDAEGAYVENKFTVNTSNGFVSDDSQYNFGKSSYAGLSLFPADIISASSGLSTIDLEFWFYVYPHNVIRQWDSDLDSRVLIDYLLSYNGETINKSIESKVNYFKSDGLTGYSKTFKITLTKSELGEFGDKFDESILNKLNNIPVLFKINKIMTKYVSYGLTGKGYGNHDFILKITPSFKLAKSNSSFKLYTYNKSTQIKVPQYNLNLKITDGASEDWVPGNIKNKDGNYILSQCNIDCITNYIKTSGISQSSDLLTNDEKKGSIDFNGYMCPYVLPTTNIFTGILPKNKFFLVRTSDSTRKIKLKFTGGSYTNPGQEFIVYTGDGTKSLYIDENDSTKGIRCLGIYEINEDLWPTSSRTEILKSPTKEIISSNLNGIILQSVVCFSETSAEDKWIVEGNTIGRKYYSYSPIAAEGCLEIYKQGNTQVEIPALLGNTKLNIKFDGTSPQFT